MSRPLTRAAYRRHLQRGAERFQAALRTGPLTAPVPTCPTWTLRDLAGHLGGVHEWVVRILSVGDGARPPRHDLVVDPDADPADWYAERVAVMLRVFDQTAEDQPCFSHQPGNGRAAYWFRRQAHEIAMHGVDAALAIGAPARYDPDLAVDGVEEVADVWAPRAQPQPVSLELHCTDRPHHWVIGPTAAPVAALAGSAANLVCWLWGRPARVESTGSAPVPQRLTGGTLTP